MLADTITAKLHLIDGIVDVYLKVKLQNTENVQTVQKQCDFMFSSLIEDENRITKQEIEDVQREINRLQRMTQLYKMSEGPNFRSTINANKEINQMYQNLLEIISSLNVFSDRIDGRVKVQLQELNEKARIAMILTDAEKKTIVQAMGFSKGHWYKCPNGHPYVIADCGGAMQVSKCNECGAPIGGQNHRLLQTNALATEMDGATHSAWSEAANMENYEF